LTFLSLFYLKDFYIEFLNCKDQNLRYAELLEISKNRFMNVKSVKSAILKQPSNLLSAIQIQYATNNNLNPNEVREELLIRKKNII